MKNHPKMTQVNIRMSSLELQRLRSTAAILGLEVSSLVRHGLVFFERLGQLRAELLAAENELSLEIERSLRGKPDKKEVEARQRIERARAALLEYVKTLT